MKTYLTKAAEETNAENVLVIHDKKLAERYTENWKGYERHSEVYVGRGRQKVYWETEENKREWKLRL